MTLDLSDEESAALLGELNRIIDGDRYPFSPRKVKAPTLPLCRACARPRARGCRKSKAVAGGQGRTLGDLLASALPCKKPKERTLIGPSRDAA